MMIRRYGFSLIFIAAALTSMQCANLAFDPYGGGGTDTGNPGMLTCGRTMFEEVESCGRWSPAAYLPGGEQQLNPTLYLSGTPKIPLGKIIAADTITADSGNILRIRFSVDTIILIDSVFVRDTVLKDTITRDTLHPDASTDLVVDNKKTDTIIIIDTVVKRDTIQTPHLDSTFIQLTDSAGAPVTITNDTVAGTKQIVYLNNGQPRIYTPVSNVSYDSAAGQVSYLMVMRASASMFCVTSNFSLKSDSGNVQMARSSALSGTTVYEKYSDADGDGYLFKTVSFLSMRSKFSGVYTSGSLRTTLEFVFDAGSDRLFSTTGDNRILSLNRVRSINGITVDSITYTIPVLDRMLDSVILLREQHPETGTMQEMALRYTCLAGSDTMDHRQNRLCAMTRHSVYRYGALQSLDIVFVPDQASLSCSNGAVTAGISSRTAGLGGNFEGRLDIAAQKLYGVYTEDGLAFDVTYSRLTDNLSWERSNQEQ